MGGAGPHPWTLDEHQSGDKSRAGELPINLHLGPRAFLGPSTLWARAVTTQWLGGSRDDGEKILGPWLKEGRRPSVPLLA